MRIPELTNVYCYNNYQSETQSIATFGVYWHQELVRILDYAD